MIENHQDLTSSELAGFCEEFGPAVRIVLDTGNTFPVAEAPLDFVRVVAPYVRYLHLKDYRVQPTDEGYRLVRCAIGDGAVPFPEPAALLAEHHDALPAAPEPGALEARHVRLLTPDWWQGYPPRSAAHLDLSNGAIYATLRAAVVHYTRCLTAGVMADDGRVNAVSPGPTKTARFEATRTVDPEKMDAAHRSLDRYGEPDVVAFLAGPQARFVNGQVIRVDGGHLLFPG